MTPMTNDSKTESDLQTSERSQPVERIAPLIQLWQKNDGYIGGRFEVHVGGEKKRSSTGTGKYNGGD